MLLLLCGELRLLLEMKLSKLDLLLLPSMMRQLLLLLPNVLVSCHGSLLMVLWQQLKIVLRRYHRALWRTMLLYLIVMYLGASKGLGTRQRRLALLTKALSFLLRRSICTLLESRLLSPLQCLLVCSLRSAICPMLARRRLLLLLAWSYGRTECALLACRAR